MNFRKKNAFSLRTSILCVGLLLAGLPSLTAEAPPLKVGAAKIDIAPKDLTGLIGMSPKRYQGVHDHLYARALVIDNSVTTAAIVALDLVEMGNTTPLRERIATEEHMRAPSYSDFAHA